MKYKENKSKGTGKKGSAKRSKCPWVVVPNTLQNILFPGQISSVNINEPLEKLAGRMTNPQLEEDPENPSFVQLTKENLVRSAGIAKGNYFVVFYESDVFAVIGKNSDILTETGEIQQELTAVIPREVLKYNYDPETDEDNIYLHGLLCRAIDEPADQNGKNPYTDDSLSSDEYLGSLSLSVKVQAISRITFTLNDLLDRFGELSDTVPVEVNKYLNILEAEFRAQKDCYHGFPEIRAMLETICETFNRIEREKFVTLAKQRSRLALSSLDRSEISMDDDMLDEFVSSSGDWNEKVIVTADQILASSESNIMNCIDRVARVIFIVPFIESHGMDIGLRRFISLMHSNSRPHESFVEAALSLDPIRFGEYILERIQINYQKWQISNKIDEKLSTSLNKSQTEYVLQEKLRTIQNEIENLGSDGNIASEKASLKAQIDNLKCPEKVKTIVQTEYTRYRNIPYSSPESLISRNYIDWILKLPWYPKDTEVMDLRKVKEVLDRNHYGLKEIKEQILEYLAVQNRRGKVKGRILCLVGAPGVGKTSLVKSIAEAVGRDYVRVCLGGVRDEAEIRGHRRTYLGSLPGKFITELSHLKTNDPVLLLDEIDKMSSDVRGDPSSALLEVLDPEQNQFFTDHYMDFPYDLSNVLFIATANSTDIQKPLLDRMDVVTVSGYSNEEKFNIAKNYLIPKLNRENIVGDREITFTDEAIERIIVDYTKEQGVRNLEREIDKIYRKAIVKIDIDGNMKKIEITPDDLLSYLGPIKNIISKKGEDRVGAVNGLAYSELGGDLLPIEACRYKGKGELKLTGKLGDVIKESCEIAYTAVKSVLSADNIYKDLVGSLDQYNIHIHFPDGSTPKDGPSAGIAICTVLYSIITGRSVRSDFALTGEISLLGRVLPIGGLKEKLQGAINSGVYEIILPKDNENDLEKVPEAIKKQLTFHFVDSLTEVLSLVIKN